MLNKKTNNKTIFFFLIQLTTTLFGHTQSDILPLAMLPGVMRKRENHVYKAQQRMTCVFERDDLLRFPLMHENT